ncbi:MULTISPECIES: M23 family metallopeptidase [Prochlorococcus]|uniref:M23 family metallopeptidase n=3 Tax=Prochlorococcaceae TaxID=2881426 RepID=UPI0007B34115|nr:M23 family metallopeptidase [Prochlorococcus marinus]KZR60872.1 Murein DD-endopeptidase MepM [Prochlorococcus marinus str. MIT 1312]NMO83222.1 M23 family metallopeptidase [Prochlorococcus sp. P1344]NMP06447.1 M23 family metallopeptidase [Prochlorococcus sp. P1361]NMP14026.1 M23 family metallopeptidase [Prochlorococcus sp.P1363]KZR79728.1 Murein DD-endopeptidase MepM [Prochlorococcus marinus str. MIT 1327]
MKPLLLLISSFAAPVLALGNLGSLPGYADSAVGEKVKISSTTSKQMIWIKVALPITIEELAGKLGLKATELSKLNKNSSDTELNKGRWLVLPRSVHGRLGRISYLDSDEVLLHDPSKRLDNSNKKTNRLNRLLDETKNKNSFYSFNDLNTNKNQVQIQTKITSNNILKKECSLESPCNCPTCLDVESPVNPADLYTRGNDMLHLGSIDSDSYIWPTKGVFTSGFGWRWGRMHQGIDIANKVGTPVFAAKDGIVTYAGWKGAYGYLVEIAHGGGSTTRYAHNNQILVHTGQFIPQGATISKMGSTGRSTGPHLHFEIRKKGGLAMNPVTLLPSNNV